VLVEVSVVEQRYYAVKEVLAEGLSVSEVARRYGWARQTVHRWIARYQKGGLGALADLSHRPKEWNESSTGTTSPNSSDRLLNVRSFVDLSRSRAFTGSRSPAGANSLRRRFRRSGRLETGQYRLTPDSGPPFGVKGDASVVLDALVEFVLSVPPRTSGEL
jgi:transposase-like protein